MGIPTVTVIVQGGLVQDVDIDGSVNVAVRDYDHDFTEASAEDGVYADDDGDLYIETLYDNAGDGEDNETDEEINHGARLNDGLPPV